MFSKTTRTQVKLVQVIIILIGIFVVAGFLTGCSYRDNSDSMKECQRVEGSYDKCMKILHGNGG
jgi:hypothetical protein